MTLPDGTQFMNFEAMAFVGGHGNDVMTSSNNPGGMDFNKLFGASGDDTLTASSHGATLDGGGGAANLLIAGAGADRLSGGTASYAKSNAGVTIDQTLTAGQVSAGYANGDILSNSPNLFVAVVGVIGSKFADSLSGNQNANILKGALGDDTLNGRGGHDTLVGGGGKDTFVYSAVADSTGVGFDSVSDFDAIDDVFKVGVAVTGIDNTLHSGTLNSATFDADLDGKIGHKLKAHHAIQYTPDAGNEAGKVFLIVDQDGHAGYQSGADLVIEITGGTHLNKLAVTDFTI